MQTYHAQRLGIMLLPAEHAHDNDNASNDHVDDSDFLRSRLQSGFFGAFESLM